MLHLRQTDDAVVASGDTFKWRNELREAGGTWDKINRTWRFPGLDLETVESRVYPTVKRLTAAQTVAIRKILNDGCEYVVPRSAAYAICGLDAPAPYFGMLETTLRALYIGAPPLEKSSHGTALFALPYYQDQSDAAAAKEEFQNIVTQLKAAGLACLLESHHD